MTRNVPMMRYLRWYGDTIEAVRVALQAIRRRPGRDALDYALRRVRSAERHLLEAYENILPEERQSPKVCDTMQYYRRRMRLLFRHVWTLTQEVKK